MAQYWTDFAGETTGSGRPSGWSDRPIEGPLVNEEIKDPGSQTSGLVYQYHYTGSGGSTHRCASYDAVGQPGPDVQVVARLRAGSDNFSQGGVALCIGGSIAGADAKGYAIYGNTGTGIVCTRFSGDTITTLVNQSVGRDWTGGAYYWVRAELLSDGTLRGRIWPDGSPEPASWDFSITDNNHTSGYVCLHNNYNFRERDADIFGVGTDGDPAPITEPTAGTSGTVSEPAGALSAFGARATVRSSILEAVASADSDGSSTTALSTLTAPALSDDALNALSTAAASIVAGSASGDAWTARATALAQLINQGAASEDVYREATLLFEGLITEPTAAGSRFLGAARMLSSITAGATPTEAMTALVTAVGTFTGTSSAGAVFTRSTSSALGTLTESAEASGLFGAIATTKVSVAFAAAAGAIFSAQEAGRRYLVLGAVTLTAALDLTVSMNPELEITDTDLKPN